MFERYEQPSVFKDFITPQEIPSFSEMESKKPFFLEYCNNSLRSNPAYLHDISERIGDLVFNRITKAILYLLKVKKHKDVDPEKIKKLPVNIRQFMAYLGWKPATYACLPGGNEHDIIETLLKIEMREGKDIYLNTKIPGASTILFYKYVYIAAGDTIYGGLSCDIHCNFMSKIRRNLLGEELFLDCMEKDRIREANLSMLDGKLKCYECDQLYFQKALDHIINGKDYTEIPGFEDLFLGAYEFIKAGISPEIQINKFNKKCLSLRKTFDFSIGEKEIEPCLRMQSINRYRGTILSMAMHSLVEFLNTNDRRILKKCNHCGNYYCAIRRRETQRFCSNKCRLSFHNRKRIESGEHAQYKRKKRQEGAKASYY